MTAAVHSTWLFPPPEDSRRARTRGWAAIAITLSLLLHGCLVVWMLGRRAAQENLAFPDPPVEVVLAPPIAPPPPDPPAVRRPEPAGGGGGAPAPRPDPVRAPRIVAEPPLTAPLTPRRDTAFIDLQPAPPAPVAAPQAVGNGLGAGSGPGEGSGHGSGSVAGTGSGSGPGSGTGGAAPVVDADWRPRWIRMPARAEVRRHYPAQAWRTATAGWAALRCRVGTDGRTRECRVLDHGPAGAGFDAAVLQLSQLFVVAPHTVGGEAVEGEQTITYEMIR